MGVCRFEILIFHNRKLRLLCKIDKVMAVWKYDIEVGKWQREQNGEWASGKVTQGDSGSHRDSDTEAHHTVWTLFLFLHPFYLFIYIYNYLLLFKYSCLHFSPPLPPHHLSPPPTFDSTPLWLCPCVLYTCSLMTLPLFPPHYLSLFSPLVTISLFFISVSLVIFCLPVCLVD